MFYSVCLCVCVWVCMCVPLRGSTQIDPGIPRIYSIMIYNFPCTNWSPGNQCKQEVWISHTTATSIIRCIGFKGNLQETMVFTCVYSKLWSLPIYVYIYMYMYKCSIFKVVLKWKPFRSHIPVQPSTSSMETTSSSGLSPQRWVGPGWLHRGEIDGYSQRYDQPSSFRRSWSEELAIKNRLRMIKIA